jgi:hypothetical protein
MNSAAAVLTSVLCAGLGFAGFWWLSPRSDNFGMFESGAADATLRIVLSFAAVIVGVVLGSLYRTLKSLGDEGKKDIGNAGRFLSRAFRSIDMWLGLVAAPLVYAVLLQSTSGMALSGLVVVGLQNGFCCLVVANALLEKPVK